MIKLSNFILKETGERPWTGWQSDVAFAGHG